jgi:hypothetical protein
MMSEEELKEAIKALRNLETQINRIIAELPNDVEVGVTPLDFHAIETREREMLQLNVRRRLL